MESFKISYKDIALLGAVLGYALGFIPVIFGIVRRRVMLGIFGLLCSIISGALASFFLALPTVAVFVWLITRDARPVSPAPDEKELAGGPVNS